MLNKQTNLPIAVAGWIGVGGKWRGKIAGFSCLDCKLYVISCSRIRDMDIG